MKIHAKTWVEVELDPYEQKRVAIKTILDVFGLTQDHWVHQNGTLMITKTYATSHSWTEEEEVREATTEEIAAQVVLNKLKV